MYVTHNTTIARLGLVWAGYDGSIVEPVAEVVGQGVVLGFYSLAAAALIKITRAKGLGKALLKDALHYWRVSDGIDHGLQRNKDCSLAK